LATGSKEAAQKAKQKYLADEIKAGRTPKD